MKKFEYLETMRGLACVLLVLFHAAGSYSSNGLRLPDDDALRIFNNLLQDLRMPLFSFISGFVFLVAVKSASDAIGACVKKLRRLYIPMAAASSILFLLKEATNGNGQQFFEIFYRSYEHLWYLQATIVLMFSHILIVFLTRIDDSIIAALIGVFGSIIYILYYDKITDLMSLNGAFYLSPYFFAGYVVSHRYRAWAKTDATSERNKKNWLSLAAAGAALLIVQYPLKTDMFSFPEEMYRAIRIAMGLAVCSAFMFFRVTNRSLMWLGSKSYPIYLYHVVFAAAVRQTLIFMIPGVSPYLLVVPILIGGLFGPVLVEWIAMRWASSALLILGIRKRSARTGGLIPAAA